ncbi:MAG: hypothetical protein KAS19_01290 [Anaerolineales bacterium]|nr:hypothetical protein [Anaerolineales bacterium]
MNNYVPTDYQKKAFRVVDCGDYLELERVPHRQFPTKHIHKAFQYSIAKWTVIRELLERLERDVDLYDCGEDETCALCKMCFGCNGCPIALYVDNTGCEGTPYLDWWDDDIKNRLENTKKELAFLQKVYRWWMMRGE